MSESELELLLVHVEELSELPEQALRAGEAELILLANEIHRLRLEIFLTSQNNESV